jgi:hypothetical protein
VIRRVMMQQFGVVEHGVWFIKNRRY